MIYLICPTCEPMDAETSSFPNAHGKFTIRHFTSLAAACRVQYRTLPGYIIAHRQLRHTTPQHTKPHHIMHQTIPYHTIPYHTIPHSTTPHITLYIKQYHTIPYHAKPHHIVLDPTIPYVTIPPDATPRHTKRNCPHPTAHTYSTSIPFHPARYPVASSTHRRSLPCCRRSLPVCSVSTTTYHDNKATTNF